MNAADLAARVGVAGDPDLEDELGVLVRGALAVAKPHAAFRECRVEGVVEGRAILNGVEFGGGLLSSHLKDLSVAFPFVATCGTELAEWVEGLADPLLRYWADRIAEAALRAAVKSLTVAVDEAAGMTRAASLNPGSLADWPLSEQVPLFRVLGDVEELVGVTLTASLMMKPTKSVSGIRFAVEEAFESCMLCPREACPERRAPYEPVRS